MILTSEEIGRIGGSLTVVRQEFEYFSKRMPTALFSRKPEDGPLVCGENLLYFEYPRTPTRLSSLLLSLCLTFLMLVNCTSKRQVTTYHAHDVVVGSVAALVAKLLGIHLVLTVHGPAAYEYTSFHRTPLCQFGLRDRLYLRILWAIENFAYKNAEVIVAVSDFEKKFIEKVRSENVFVVRNGIDLNSFSPERDKKKVRSLVGLPTDKKIVTFVGRIVPKNGVIVIAQATARVLTTRADVHFVFVGDGFAKDECREIIDRAGASDGVTFTGMMGNPIPYYQVSDLFVSHVSSLVEGIGLGVLEAMGCGIPVIVGDDPMSRELLAGPVHLVRKDDPPALVREIVEVLDDVDLKDESARVRRFAERYFDLDRTLNRYSELLFEDIVAEEERA
jgi:glycosyltransferase involved in cell wall biosynthesis